MERKPHRTYEQQLEILLSRGMVIPDPTSALRDLQNIGYYRLKAYSYVFREVEGFDHSGKVSRSEHFVPNTSFSDVQALWMFDRKLRLLLLDAIELIEVALRVRMSHCLGARDPYAHLHPSSLDAARCAEEVETPLGRMTSHSWWLHRYEERLSGTQDDILRLYRSEWDLKPPVWVAVELLDFGMLSTLIRQFLTKAQVSEISQTFGIAQGSFLGNWIKVINHVRNMCAHHARVWNQPVTFRLQRIPKGLSGPLDPIAALTGTPKTRIYSVVHICAYILETLGDHSEWFARTRALISSFPSSQYATLKDLGAPDDWHSFDLWNR